MIINFELRGEHQQRGDTVSGQAGHSRSDASHSSGQKEKKGAVSWEAFQPYIYSIAFFLEICFQSAQDKVGLKFG